MQSTITHTDYRALYEQSQFTIAALQHELAQLKKLIFGSKHERFMPTGDNGSEGQLSLDIQAEAIATCSVIDTKKIEYTRKVIAVEKNTINHPGRMKLPEHLRREEIIVEPTIDITGFKMIGTEITEELEYKPGELYVNKYIRPKYVATLNNQTIIQIAELPVRPIDKCIAGPGLLTQIVIDKYLDHLPLYRQMQRFERAAVKIPYSTINDWVTATCKLITPLYEALIKALLQSNYLHADETGMKVLDKDKKGTSHRGWFWVYHNSNKIVVFDYRQGRGREGPWEMLQQFKGFLQTDGYAAYNDFEKKNGIKLLHFMAHSRRKFSEAIDNDRNRSEYALDQMRQLYAIERQCKEGNLTAGQIAMIRNERSLPILQALGKWMKEQYLQVLPKSIIGQALAYSIERWDKLSIYATNGILNIDNNPVENSIRPVAIGRKNYLFCGSHEAAKRSAILYSLMGTCKLNNINPFDYLKI